MSILSRQVRTIAGSTLTTSFQNVGAVVTIPGRLVAIVNSTTTDVIVTDGSASDPWYLPANSTINAGETTTSSPNQTDSALIAVAQTQYQAKLPTGAAGTGTLVITTLGN